MWYSRFTRKSDIGEKSLGKGWITPDNDIIDIDMYHNEWSELHGSDYGCDPNRDSLLENGWCRIYPSRYSINFTFPVNYIDSILPRVMDYVYLNIDKIKVPIEIELTDKNGHNQYSLHLFPLELFLSLDIEDIKRSLKC